MKKIIVLFVSVLIGNALFAQKLVTHTGEIKFDASMPNLVEIAGTNDKVSSIFEEATGRLVALALVKEFKFKSPLMEEHFNENYMESSKFTNAKFDGKLVNFDASKLTNAKTAYEVEGDLTIHGVTKKVKTKVFLMLVGGKVIASGNFTVHAQDYGVEIPSLVKEKFAEQIKVAFNFSYDVK
jgi:hypothetical protein